MAAGSIRSLFQFFLGSHSGARPSELRGQLQIDALDGVRGLAVVLVMFSHAANEDLVLVDGLKFAGDGSGRMGVYLFFVLSAFLLTRGLLRSRASRENWPRVGLDYAARRVLRIYPLYAVVLAAVLLGTRLGVLGTLGRFDGLMPADVLRHLGLQEGRVHLWSIAVEVKYYFLLPVFVLVCTLLLRRDVVKTLLLTIVVSAVATVATARYGAGNPLALVQYLPIFLSGSLAAVIYEGCAERVGVRSARALASLGTSILALLVLLMPNAFHLATGRWLLLLEPAYSVYWGVLFGALILCTLLGGGLSEHLFRHPVLRWIGIVSFSAYLWHWFVLANVAPLDGIPKLARLTLFWVATGLVSALSFALFERPLSRIRIYRAPPARAAG